MKNLKKITGILTAILIMTAFAAFTVTVYAAPKEALTENWSADSPVAESLRDYVTKVTDENDEENFIPVKDRIAVFDMDGTLTCETFFTYYDTMMFIDYCNNDIDDNDRLSKKDKEVLKKAAAEIDPAYKAGEELARNFARAYTGMTVDELYDYAVEFGKKETESFKNMRYIDGFYLPMAELVEYLYDNDFTIYVISGTERTTSRAIIANSPISDFVSPAHIIGTEFEVKVEGHEQMPSNMDYKYGEDGEDEKLVFTGGFVQKNLNANKTIEIEREIGQRPVLAFGNSGSDTSMLNYALIDNKYPSEAYMIVGDDTEREWGPQNWDEKSEEYIKKGYIPVSMKNDFAKIYPDEISKAETQYQAPEEDSDADSKEDSKEDLKDQPEADTKGDSKEDTKDQPEAETKDDSKKDTKDQPEAETKDDSKTDTKDQPKTDSKKDSKKDAKDNPKTDPKKDSKKDVKDNPKTDPKEDSKKDTKDNPKAYPKDHSGEDSIVLPEDIMSWDLDENTLNELFDFMEQFMDNPDLIIPELDKLDASA